MKLFAVILSVYVMVLSGIACVDNLQNTGTAQVSIQSASPVASDCCLEVCSPFCTCQCCGISFFSFNPPDDGKPIPTNRQRYLTHLPSRVFDVSLSVWQPPQLV